MKLRIIHVWTSAGVEHVFAFLVLPEGVEFEFAGDAEAVPVLQVATNYIAPQLWLA